MNRDAMNIIRHRLNAELDKMNTLVRESLYTDNLMMRRVVEQYLLTKGKQIRPILVLLSANMFGGANDATLHAAAALEMLHNASLIHDDVVDNSDYRRGVPTLNHDFDNRIAVLTGDYFVSNALAEVLKTGDMRAIKSIAELGKELSLGEIDQITNARDGNLEEQRYFEVIEKKTASLFMKCVRLGAESTNADPSDVERAEKFGHLLGLCFQIKDDIFDYFEDDAIGKPTGNDLRENKVSLPLIYAIRKASPEKQAEFQTLLTKGSLSDSEISILIEFAKDNGGIDYAYSVMEKMRDEGKKICVLLPDNEWRALFSDLFDFTISRKY